jgi:hypothetical protein
LFQRLSDARKTDQINALIIEVDVWDRKGEDLAANAFGNSVRQTYRSPGTYEFYPPNYLTIFSSPEAVAAFFRRRDTLNRIRHRQQALSALFVVPPTN